VPNGACPVWRYGDSTTVRYEKPGLCKQVLCWKLFVLCLVKVSRANYFGFPIPKITLPIVFVHSDGFASRLLRPRIWLGIAQGTGPKNTLIQPPPNPMIEYLKWRIFLSNLNRKRIPPVAHWSHCGFPKNFTQRKNSGPMLIRVPFKKIFHPRQVS
jgi:hypothetical protein